MEFSPFLLTIIGNILVAIGIIIVIYLTKILRNSLIKYLEYITALTVGLLLGIIFLGFIPEIISEGNLVGNEIGIFILIGIFIFYLLELFLHWHHCKDLGHRDECKSHHIHEHQNGSLMFGGTLLHNAFHGIVLFSAFSVNFGFGVATTLAVLLHSIPQNIVNYIMNHDNIKYSYFAALGGVLGALITYPFSDFLVLNKYFILTIIAGGLLYTSLADIFPEFKGKGTISKKISYLIFIIIGIFAFLGFNNIAENSHENAGNTAEIINNIVGENAVKCSDNGGNWLPLSSECDGISKDICENIGGNFNECASPCRNDPSAEECIMMCEQVCQFNK